jgi:acetyl esterase/lipase
MKQRLLFLFFSIILLRIDAQTQPAQPLSGYGGLAAPYSTVTVVNCDDGATGFMLYIPSSPHADTLPLVVFDHGFGEWNPLRYGRWIDHIVKRGNIVIFPRYQTNEYTTPSVNFTPNAVTGIKRAIDTLKAHIAWTQPELDKVFYLGHSYGGLISANLATNHVSYGIPKPKAVLLACPGYGQYPGGQLSSYSAMDSSIYMLDIFEHDDTVVDSTFALQVFNQTTSVPYAHKNLVIHFADNGGTPAVTSSHGEASCIDSTYDNTDRGVVMAQASYAHTDVTDFYCYWKLFDALEDCALTGNGCGTSFGDTSPQKTMGSWSNGTAIRPLQVRPAKILTAIQDYAETKAWRLYPNPGNGIFRLEAIGAERDKNCTVDIYNVLGMKIYSKKEAGSVSFSIDLSTQPAGSFFYRIMANDGTQMTSGKLLIEK